MQVQPNQINQKAGVAIRIRAAGEGLKPAERAIAEVVLKEPAAVIHMAISELAHRAGVGESTIVRFCRTIGYTGYQDFKLRLAQDLVESADYIHERLSFNDNVGQLAAKIFQSNIQAIEDTRKAIDSQQIEKAATRIAQARKMEIYGVGYSFFTALDAKFKFMRLGLIADGFGDGHFQAMSASALSKKDVAIGISHSGTSRDTIDALSIAKKAGALTVAITNFNPTPMTSVADVVLLTAASHTPLGGDVLTSRIAQLCVVDLLSAAVAIQLGRRCLGYIQKASESIKARRY